MAARKTSARYTRWIFVSYKCDDRERFTPSDENIRYCVFQEEICPTTQKHHYQGFLQLHRQTDFGTVKKYFTTDPSIHLERCKGTSEQARRYSMKEETRFAGPWETGIWQDAKSGERNDLDDARETILAHTSWAAVIADPTITKTVARHLTWAREVYNSRPSTAPAPEIELRTWQHNVMEMLKEPPKKRRIIWIWSSESGTGKTTFYDYVSAAMPTLPGADWTNTLYLYDGHKVIWFDRTRAESDNWKSVDTFYSDLERWSNCTTHTSTKYNCTRKFVNAHIVVTANAAPDDFRLPDRFVVIRAELPPPTPSNPNDLTAPYVSDDE